MAPGVWHHDYRGLANFTVPVTVTVQPEAVHEADVLLVAAKTYAMESALQSVVSVQNGVLKNEQVYVVFVGSMTVAALTRLETYKMHKAPDLAYVNVMLQREMALLATTLGLPFGDYGRIRAKTLTSIALEAVAHLRQTGESQEAQGATAHKMSTLQDLERGRRLEIEETLGYAVRKGTELNVQLPTVTTCYKLLTGINSYL